MRRLNQQAWPDAYRALLLDLAGAYREIADIKFEEKRPHEKVRCPTGLQQVQIQDCGHCAQHQAGMQSADSCCCRGGPPIL